MKPEQILKLPSMPAASPSYPMGPYRLINREFMIVTYETDRDFQRQAVPEPLEPNPEGQVLYEWIRMPDSSGFGDYTGERNSSSPVYTRANRSISRHKCTWMTSRRFRPGAKSGASRKKYALPKLEVCSDTLTGTLHYAGQLVAMGTMAYKHQVAPGGA